jgi:hypothetical protein
MNTEKAKGSNQHEPGQDSQKANESSAYSSGIVVYYAGGTFPHATSRGRFKNERYDAVLYRPVVLDGGNKNG